MSSNLATTPDAGSLDANSGHGPVGWSRRPPVASVVILWLALSLSGTVAYPAHAGMNVWTGNGPRDQNIVALAIDPVTPTTIYAGSSGSTEGALGGVHKSIDGGTSWAPVLSNASVSALAIDPSTPMTIYAAVFGAVQKSTDGAEIWNDASSGLTGLSSLNVLAIDPTNPQTLYAGTDQGVFKSTNGAGSWSPDGLSTETILALAIDPVTSTTLYAGTSIDGVFKRTAGNDWSNVTGSITGSSNFQALAIDPASPTTVYLGTETYVYKTTDGGVTWDYADKFLSLSCLALVIDPQTSTTLYVGTAAQGVYKSIDGGASWNSVNTGLPTSGFTGAVVNIPALAIDPLASSSIYAGTSGNGVFAIQQVEPTPMSTATPTPTPSLTPTVAPTASPSPSPTSTCTPTPTRTPSVTPTEISTASPSPTSTPSGTPTPTLTPDSTSTAVPTASVSPTSTPTLAVTCIGDCNGDGTVTINDILTMVNVALENAEVAACLAGDTNHDGQITVDEILTAVNHALNGCS